MNLLIGTQRVTSDSVIGTSGKSVRVYWVHLVSGGSASTAILKNGTTSSDDSYIQIDGLASLGVTINFAGGCKFSNGCYFDSDSNISYAIVGYTEEF